jgi:hypothetical protein
MRSTDLVLGFCNDIYQFSQLQRLVLERLPENIKLGTITLFTNSLHLYETNYNMVDEFYDTFDLTKDKYTYCLRDYTKDVVQIKKKDLDALVELEKLLRMKKNPKQTEILIESLKRTECKELKDMLHIIMHYHRMTDSLEREFATWA